MSRETLENPIEFLKGVGPARADLLKKELGIHRFRDLLFQFPYRYVDKTVFHRISDLTPDSGDVQLRGILRRIELIGQGRKKRLVGRFRDESGIIELVWFKGAYWIQNSLQVGKEYVLFGRVSSFSNKLNIAHPEIEEIKPDQNKLAASFAPVYTSTEKLNAKGLDVKVRRRLMASLLEKLSVEDLPENLPGDIVRQFRLPSHEIAIRDVHFPANQAARDASRNRLKFEELFFLQLRLLQMKSERQAAIRGYVFDQVGDLFHQFYEDKIPFELTNAQKTRN